MKPLKALLVEDSETDEELLLRQLAKANYDVQSIRVQTAADLKRALAEREWDIILSDYAMPGFSGLDALRILKESGRDIPLIIISGTIGEDVAVEAMRVGVDDYLIKGNLTRLAPAIERELENAAMRRGQRQAEESLRQSESRMRALLNAIPDLMFRFDKAGKILDFSATHREGLLLPPSEFIGKNLRDMMPLPVVEQAMRHIALVVESGTMQIFEYQLEMNGIVKTYEARIVAASGNEVTAIIRDVTERKQAEDKLRRSESALADAQRIAHTGSWDWDLQNNKLFWSEETYKIFGISKAQIKDNYEAIHNAFHPEDRQLIQSAVDAALSNSAPYSIEHRIIRQDREERIVCEIGEVTFDESGKPLRFTGTVQDITERKRAEQQIIESEARYRLLFDNSPLPMWVFDVETLRFISVNAAAINHYGFSEEEFLSMNLKDIRPPEEIENLIQHTNRSFPGIVKAGVFRHRIKNGAVIDVEIVSKQLLFEGKNAELVLANDVTERRKAEEEVQFQAHLLNTVEQSVIATDLNGNVTYWNQFAEQLYGWTSAEAVGRFVMELTTSEINLEKANQIMARLGAGKSWAGEFVVQNKAGERFPAYISNSPVADDTGKIVGFVGVSVDITERKKAETALLKAEDKYRSLVESSPAVIYLAEPVPPYSPIYVSPNIAKFGYTTEDWFSRDDLWMSLIHPEDRDRVLHLTETAMRQGQDTDLEYRIIAGNGTIHWLQDRGRFVSDQQGIRTGWQGVMLDITETKVLEEQLRQSQKLESVGRLAGGIAHDFNNMLTAINGYSELTLRKLTEDDPLRRNIEEIKRAGQRSADLTHQLLAFSRQQILQPIVLDLNETIRDTMKMLDRLIGEDVQLTTTLNPKIGRVKADQGQLSQIIINLAVNARDAMPRGGKLTIETANIFLDPNYAREHVGALPGAYVMLAVSDTGSGMSTQIKEHIFEPFFTTKEIGRGTGLGLATVYGIVKQSGGSIEVYSEEGVGTTFKIYLPRVAEQAEVAEIKDTSLELSKGTEIILLVEDEQMVRHLTHQILEECGYTVIEARNGKEALEICEQRDYKFDLLMTDVVMPQMGGSELAGLLKTKLPGLKILFTSGYTDDAVVRHGVIEVGTNFIQKPFTPEALTDKIREILDYLNTV